MVINKKLCFHNFLISCNGPILLLGLFSFQIHLQKKKEKVLKINYVRHGFLVSSWLSRLFKKWWRLVRILGSSVLNLRFVWLVIIFRRWKILLNPTAMMISNKYEIEEKDASESVLVRVFSHFWPWVCLFWFFFFFQFLSKILSY